jgi:cytochrome c oxidase subunit 3
VSKKKSIFQLLTEKPWEQDQIESDNEHEGQTVNLTKQKLGLRTLMAASTVLFSLFIVAYSDRMLVHDWRNMPEPWLLWFNTGILVLSSLVFHQTVKYAKNDLFDKTKNGLYFIGFLAYSFLIGQLIVWYQLMNSGFYATSNVANAFFYLFTTIHGLHIIGGIYFWGKTTSKFIKRSLKKEEINNLIDICAVYWHFLLAVWLVLFGLMLSS